ncbi:MAG: hypothetical protein IJ094_09585, partial [Bacilli bacterium]|nr:hypothetical protein [Bacilli bacterium]
NRKYKKYLEKIKKYLDYLNDIINRINRDILSSIDPIKKRFEIEKLNQSISDINFVTDEASRDIKLDEIQRELENIERTYNQRIMNEGDFKKRRNLGIERENKINNYNYRIKKLNEYLSLNPTERADQIRIINDNISSLNSKTEKTYEEQLEDTILIVKPLFNKYENKFDGENVELKEHGGESLFKHIMKTTDTYAKLGSKVDKIEQKLNAVNSNRESKGKIKYDDDYSSKLIIRTPNQVLPNKLREMKRKQVSVMNEQKIVMLKREQIIDKRNRNMSKLEAKVEQLNTETTRRTASNAVTKKIESANILRKKFKAWRTGVRINLLKKTPIFLANSNVILIKEEIKDSLFRKSTDKYGNMDYRPWQERALERMEEKNEMKGKKF